MLDCKKQPCNNCPYRKDAPLKHWSIDEFKDLLANDKTMMGAVYGCHKNDGKLCTGFVIDQDKRGIPSIKLRMKFSHDGTTTAELDELSSPETYINQLKKWLRLIIHLLKSNNYQ